MNDRGGKIPYLCLCALILAAFAYAAFIIFGTFGIEVPAFPWHTAIRAAISVILAASILKNGERRLISPRGANAVSAALAASCGILLQVAASSAVSLVTGAKALGVRAAPSDPAAWAAFASAVIVTPIFEELLFRGELFCLLGKRSAVAAGAATSVAFAMIHSGIASVTVAFVSALILALTVLRCGSLIPAIALHATFNLTSFFTGYIPIKPAAALAVSAPLAAVGVTVLLKGKKNEAL